jgi:glutamate/tyrosine decarboxylase-like PLP-dependent enzyme
MRRIGYHTVDMLVNRMTAQKDLNSGVHTSPQALARLLEDPPEQGQDFEAIVSELEKDVLPAFLSCDHPNFFAFIPGSSTWPGALADLIASALNVHATSWLEAPGPSQIELVVLDWFKSWISYPSSASGVLVSGGSAANMTALACAREALLGVMTDKAVVYVSDQAHSSMARAARILGFHPDQVRVLPTDEYFRLRPDALEEAMASDVGAGRRPLFVAASGGSTNTGAVDPLPRIAEVCRDHGVWFHVDAAYGGFATLTARGRELMSGIELADSVTLDPHKWLYQPFECGCLLVREGLHLRRAFEIVPDYLADSEATQDEVNFCDLGVQLTRGWRALKVWMSLKYFGVDAFRQAVETSMELAAACQRRIEESDELELMAPATLGVVCFRRYVPDADEETIERVNASLTEGLLASGVGMVSSTRLRGRYALRMCILNYSSTEADVTSVLEWLENATPTDAAAAPKSVATFDRNPSILKTSAAEAGVQTATAREVPLFQSLSDTELAAALVGARETRIGEGEVVLRRWDYGRDFYVVIEGTLRVHVDEELVRELEPGDFFGELAALDWGAGYGYPRLATVVAQSATRLLVFPPERLRELVSKLPDLERQVRAASSQRLRKI